MAGAALAAGAAVPRTWDLMRDDLRLDEAFTSWVGTLPVGEIPGLLARMDTHPPLHYLLVALVPGRISPVALRGLSAVCGVATVVLVAALAHRLTGRRVAFLVAGVVAAVTPGLVIVSRIGRMYALAALLVVVAVGAAVVWADDDRPASALAVGVLGGLAMLAHVSAIPPVVTAVMLVVGRHVWRRRWRSAGWLVGALVVVWGPWVPALVEQVRHADRNLSWMGQPSWERTMDGVAGTWWRWGSPRPVVVGLVVVLVGAVVVVWRWRRFDVAVVTASALTAVVVPVLASGLVQQLPLPRSIAVAAPLVAVLAGVVVAALPRGRWWVGAGVAVAAVAVTGGRLGAVATDVTASGFRAASAALVRAVDPDDAIVYVGSYAQLPFEWYQPALAQPTVRGVPTTFTERPQWEAPVGPDDAVTVRAVAADHDVIHHVQLRADDLDPDDVVARTLDETHDPVAEAHFRGLTITRYEREDAEVSSAGGSPDPGADPSGGSVAAPSLGAASRVSTHAAPPTTRSRTSSTAR